MKKRLSKSLLMTALITGMCIGGGQGAFAAEGLQEFTLDPMIVTATRTEKNLMKVPASVSVITAQEIQERNVNSVKEVLKHQPGIYMDPNADAFGGIQMRGMGDANILIMYDGQPLNNGWNGQVGIDAIPIEQIERIEVVRGAASSLYGGRAVAGVINIISKKVNNKGVNGNIVISGGSNDTWKKAIDVRGKINDKWSFAVGYEDRETDGVAGYRKTVSAAKSGTATDNVTVPQLSSGKYEIGGRGPRYHATESYNTSIQYNFDEEKSLKYNYMHSEHDYRYNNPFTNVKNADGKEYFNGTFMTQNGDLLTIKYSDYLGYVSERETDYHILNYNDTKNLWMVNLGLQNVKRDGYASTSSAKSLDDNASGTFSSYPSKNYNMDMQKTWENLGKHTITVGANWKDEQMVKDSFPVSNYKDLSSITGPSTESSRGKTQTMSLFIQDEYKLSDPFTLYLGGRYDYYKKYDGWSNTRGDIPEASYNEFSPKVSLEYSPADDWTYFVTYGHSFNPPKLYNVYRDTASYAANPELKPETSDTYEFGVKKKLDKTILGLSLYKINTEDAISSTASPYLKEGSTTSYKTWYDNMKEQERKGIEFEVRHEFDEKLSAYLNYAWQKGKNINKTGTNTDINTIPEHLLHFGVDYNIGKFNAILDAQYVSERQGEDAVTGEYGAEEAYFVVNTYFNYKITPQATLQFGIDNIFDKEYYAGYAASEGRTYNVSLRYSF